MKAHRLIGARNLAACVVAGLSCASYGSSQFTALPLDRMNRPIDPMGQGASMRRFAMGLPPYLKRERDTNGFVAGTRKPAHPATTREVTNCDDSGSGSLRDTIASAVSGDIVDLSRLTCSTITLTSSYLTVLQDDLTILGPGATSLAIDGGGVLSLFANYGAGTLSIDGLTLTNGYYYYHGTSLYTRGGCIVSVGNVAIQDSIVSNCTLKGNEAEGGAIFTFGDLSVVNSLITHNQVIGTSLAGSGAAYVSGDLTLQYSTISDNVASSPGPYSLVGGVHSFGNVLVENSTLSGNQARNFAAFSFSAHDGSPTALIVNSTVSGNIATYGGSVGGVYSTIPLSIYNSTIAFNAGQHGHGLYVYDAPLIVQSSIIADNAAIDLLIGGTATLSGANDLIYRAPVVPPGTIRSCPQLGPLIDNGGITLTHMLRSTSPAIDTGSNPTSAMFDQRGTAYPRLFGSAPDIGATEWSGLADERIFRSGFETDCDE